MGHTHLKREKTHLGWDTLPLRGTCTHLYRDTLDAVQEEALVAEADPALLGRALGVLDALAQAPTGRLRHQKRVALATVVIETLDACAHAGLVARGVERALLVPETRLPNVLESVTLQRESGE